MIKKLILRLTGILMTSYGLMFIIIYLNLLKMNYTFIEYLIYILTHAECLIIFMGIILIAISLRKEKDYELYI